VTEVAALFQQLGALSTPLLGDAQGGGILPSSIQSQYELGQLMAGPAYTIELDEGDNLGVHVAIVKAAPGSVIVAKVRGDEPYGIWGAIAATAAKERGIAGFVTNGCVRDSAEFRSIGLPTFAGGKGLRKTRKEDEGRHEISVHFDGVTVEPGDWVLGDNDGVVVVPQARLRSVVDEALRLLEQERAIFEGLRSGKTTLDLLDLPQP
jgi:4-hydroxy-4-methyl-2-oxoglutarate aldolase